jgi:shikimate kinase
MQASQSGIERPLLHSLEDFRKLYDTRRKGYARASWQILTGSRTVEAIVADIAETLSLKKIVTRTEQGEVE